MNGNIIHTAVSHPDELPEEIRVRLTDNPENIVFTDEYIYLVIGQDIYVLTNDNAGRTLAYAAKQKHRNCIEKPRNSRELFGKLLNDSNYLPDSSILKLLNIRDQQKRCVTVYQSFSPMENDMSSIISLMAPVEESDSVIPIDYQTAVHIRDCENVTAEENKEFTAAVIGTMETEGIIDVYAGIGRECRNLNGLRNSFSEGKQSLNLGMKYNRKVHVFAFSDQLLERIVDSVPENEKKIIQHELFGQNAADVFSEEMLETVHVFFQNDLNLSAASKQLFIHRNTLNYRLDKIKKDFGLDLRSFKDAVIFRIISEFRDRC